MKGYEQQEQDKLIREVADMICRSVLRGDMGNYWVNKQYNIFCEKGYILTARGIEAAYYCISLEVYDKKGHIIDCQYDYEQTKSMEEHELRAAIRKIVERNSSAWTEK